MNDEPEQRRTVLNGVPVIGVETTLAAVYRKHVYTKTVCDPCPLNYEAGAPEDAQCNFGKAHGAGSQCDEPSIVWFTHEHYAKLVQLKLEGKL